MVADDGTPYVELDSSQMYDYYFVGLPMDETDPVIPADKTDGAVYDYFEFTNDDPTWIQDSTLIRTLGFSYTSDKSTWFECRIRIPVFR